MPAIWLPSSLCSRVAVSVACCRPLSPTGGTPGSPLTGAPGSPFPATRFRGVRRVGVGVPHEVDDDVGFARGELDVGHVDDLRQWRRRWGEGDGPGADQRDTGDNLAVRLSRRWLRWTGHHFCTSSRNAYDG